MYTVYDGDGKPKYNRIGLVVFVRSLKEAREAAEPGDRIVGWSSSGYARRTWECGQDGKCRVLPKPQR